MHAERSAIPHPTIDLELFVVPVYTGLIALGAVAGLAAAYVVLRSRSRRASAPGAYIDGALIVFIAGWIGARAYHILTNWDYYRARPEEITAWGVGGLGMRGALMLGVLAVLLFARVRRFSAGHLLDAAAVGLAIGQTIGWIGALVQGANYGVVSDSAIAQELPDLYGLTNLRFPVQHAEIALFAVILAALGLLALERRPAGWLFGVYLLLSSLGNFALGFERGDQTAYVGALRVDQLVDAALVPVALAGLSVLTFKTRRGATETRHAALQAK